MKSTTNQSEGDRPIDWDPAFELVAGELYALGSPDEALFYTSSRTSDEAAFPVGR